ncbi:MAG TPA: hypothetical protein VFJ22_16460 [Dermatophilaceae bacterium]|nr:hypothetical protein [Dermatophilaceae bacterium]
MQEKLTASTRVGQLAAGFPRSERRVFTHARTRHTAVRVWDRIR